MFHDTSNFVVTNYNFSLQFQPYMWATMMFCLQYVPTNSNLTKIHGGSFRAFDD